MGTEMLKRPVELMSEYNYWANTQYADFFRVQDSDLVEQYIPNSFPSIRKTLMHIWDAQHIWYRRLHGESPRDFLSSSWEGSLEEMYAGLVASSRDFVDLTNAMTDEQLDEVINYSTVSSGGLSSRRYEILLHVFNHSMYHRGQCVTMARLLEMQDVPSIDLIHYLRIAPLTGR